MIQSVVIGLLRAADVNNGTPITITEPKAKVWVNPQTAIVYAETY